MDLNLSDEEREIREWVRTFVRKEVMPLEQEVLNRERRNERGLRADELEALQHKAKEAGFFGVHTPEEYGGMGLGAVMNALVEVELGRSFVPFKFGGDADNILYVANDEQRATYLVPTINGERKSCFAITEPGAGSDARSIRTTARREGDEWVINGEKTFITGGNDADFTMVFAVTDPDKHKEGRTVLFPIKIDDAVMESKQAWAAAIRRTRHIGDFTKWKDHDSYQRAFERLLRDLKAQEKKP